MIVAAQPRGNGSNRVSNCRKDFGMLATAVDGSTGSWWASIRKGGGDRAPDLVVETHSVVVDASEPCDVGERRLTRSPSQPRSSETPARPARLSSIARPAFLTSITSHAMKWILRHTLTRFAKSRRTCEL